MWVWVSLRPQLLLCLYSSHGGRTCSEVMLQSSGGRRRRWWIIIIIICPLTILLHFSPFLLCCAQISLVLSASVFICLVLPHAGSSLQVPMISDVPIPVVETSCARGKHFIVGKTKTGGTPLSLQGRRRFCCYFTRKEQVLKGNFVPEL